MEVKFFANLRMFESALFQIAFAINQIKGPQTAEIWRQVQKIQSCLHGSILNRVENISSLDHLYQLTLGLVMQARNRVSALFGTSSEP